MKQNNEDKTQQSSLFPLNINKMHVSLSGSSDGVSLTIETHQGQNKNQQNPPPRNSTETSQVFKRNALHFYLILKISDQKFKNVSDISSFYFKDIRSKISKLHESCFRINLSKTSETMPEQEIDGAPKTMKLNRKIHLTVNIMPCLPTPCHLPRGIQEPLNKLLKDRKDIINSPAQFSDVFQVSRSNI